MVKKNDILNGQFGKETELQDISKENKVDKKIKKVVDKKEKV